MQNLKQANRRTESAAADAGSRLTRLDAMLSPKDAQMQTDVKNLLGFARYDGDYADEATRMRYEVAAAVRELDRTLPPETRGTIPLRSVSFPDEAIEKAETALFFA